MNLKLEAKSKKSDSIEKTLPVPMPDRLKREVEALKKVCGKEVNKKAREFFESLVRENKDKIEKAS